MLGLDGDISMGTCSLHRRNVNWLMFMDRGMAWPGRKFLLLSCSPTLYPWGTRMTVKGRICMFLMIVSSCRVNELTQFMHAHNWLAVVINLICRCFVILRLVHVEMSN